MTAQGWVALAGALPSLPALEDLHLEGNKGLGSEEVVAALVAAIPNCPGLWFLSLDACELRHEDKARLQALSRDEDDPGGRLDVSLSESVTVPRTLWVTGVPHCSAP